MNKPLAALGGLAATASVATPAILLTGGGSGNTGENQEPTPENQIPQPQKEDKTFKEPNWNKAIPKLSSANDVKNNYQQVDCLKRYGNLDLNSQRTDGSDPYIDIGFKDDKSTGCLTVEYYKQTFEGDKWSGEFKLVWSISSETEGVITSFHAKTEAGKLSVNSAAYYVKEDDSKWDLMHSKVNSSATISDENELSKKLPKPGAGITDSKYKNNYWGFNPSLDKICGDDCKNTNGAATVVSATWDWKYSADGPQGINWSDSFETWFASLFWKDLIVQLKEIKGSWTLRANQ